MEITYALKAEQGFTDKVDEVCSDFLEASGD